MTRGFALFYKIRKTTTQNETGDNFSITIPRFIAKQFENVLFRLEVSGNCFMFTSGCKIDNSNINKKIEYVGGVPIAFE